MNLASILSPRYLLLFAVAFSTTHAMAARNILILGDSLSAGYGIRQEAAWPSLLQKRLQEKKFDYSVVNASISGETTSGGRSRITALLAKHRPVIVIVALGSNDGLRGLPVATLRDNLSAIVDSSTQAKAKVLLIGQRLPPNYGPYASDFQHVFSSVATAKKTAHLDFLLAGIASRMDYFQADGLHPTTEAQPILTDTVWKALEPLLK